MGDFGIHRCEDERERVVEVTVGQLLGVVFDLTASVDVNKSTVVVLDDLKCSSTKLRTSLAIPQLHWKPAGPIP